MDEWVQLNQLDLSTVEIEIQDPDPKKWVLLLHAASNTVETHADMQHPTN